MDIEYIVKSSSSKMPINCWGSYKRIGILKVEKNTKPSMISDRCKGVLQVVKTWENLNVGKTKKCAFEKALVDAYKEARRLNVRHQALQKLTTEEKEALDIMC